MGATKQEESGPIKVPPPAPRGAERRQAPRVLVDLEVDYAREENFLFAYITDISATGIFIRTTQPEAPGTELNLRFTPPPDEPRDDDDDDGDDDGVVSSGPMAVEGEVIWINPYRPGDTNNIDPGMGVRFIGLTDDDRARLVRLVRRFAYL